MFSPKHCLQPPPQPNIIVFLCTIRYSSGRREAGLLPQDWGWKESDGKLIPVTSDLDPAPIDLLRVVRCNCQTDCNTLRCSCKKHGLTCPIACGNCRGSGCVNSSQLEEEVDDEAEQID